jgi:hypothetical protein
MNAAVTAAAGIACWTAAALVPAGAPRDPATLVRAAARPLLLPPLWNGVAAAERSGSPTAYVAQGRWLLDLLPRWTDGWIHFAAKLGFDASIAAAPGPESLDHLLDALALLETALARHPTAADRLLGAMASFVAIRTEQDPVLAAAWRARAGGDPADAVDRLLARAIDSLPPDAGARLLLGERRAWLSLRLIAGALRTGDRARARALVELARGRFAEVRDRQNAAEWQRSLDLVARALDRDPTLATAELRADPRLAELLPLLGR